jgi:hypothetical protein
MVDRQPDRFKGHWIPRMYRSMRRERFTRRKTVAAIAGDVLRGFRAKYVRRIP